MRVGVINDLHLPYHDDSAVTLAITVLADADLDMLVLNGDILDFHNINRHKKAHIELQTSLEDEFYVARKFFEIVRKKFINKGVKVVYIRGNHEEWLDDFINTNCPAFWNFCRLEAMLDLRDITVIPYNQWYQPVPDVPFRIQHSPPKYGINGCRNSLTLKGDMSYVWGCSHQMQYACRTNDSGKVYEAFFNGWLGSQEDSADHRLVFKYKKNHLTWQQCFLITDLLHGEHFTNQIIIKQSEGRYFCNYNGNLYEV